MNHSQLGRDTIMQRHFFLRSSKQRHGKKHRFQANLKTFYSFNMCYWSDSPAKFSNLFTFHPKFLYMRIVKRQSKKFAFYSDDTSNLQFLSKNRLSLSIFWLMSSNLHKDTLKFFLLSSSINFFPFPCWCLERVTTQELMIMDLR